MSKSKSSLVEYDGARIFGSINANKNDTHDEQQATIFIDNSQQQTSIEQKVQLTNHSSQCYLSSEKLNEIFANIDKQIRALDQLHPKQIIQSSLRDNYNQTESEKEKFCKTERNRLQRRHSSSISSNSHLLAGERQRQLDHYINHSIKSELVDCSCCYRFDSNACHLLNELSECYGQSNGDSRETSVSPTSASVNCHGCRREQQQQQNNEHVCLAQSRESSAYRASSRPSNEKQGYASLFIENNYPNFSDSNHLVQSTEISEYLASDCAAALAGQPFQQTINHNHNNNNDDDDHCYNCCCHDHKPTATFASISAASSAPPKPTPPTRTTTNILEFSVLANSGYNYIFGPSASGDESPLSETGNALDRVADSPFEQHNWPPDQQQQHQTTYQSTSPEHCPHLRTLSSPNLEHPSEPFAYEEAHLDCSLTYKSSELLSQSLELQTESDCCDFVEGSGSDLIAARETSAWPPQDPLREPSGEDERISVEWASRNSSQSESNSTSSLLFAVDLPARSNCNSSRRRGQAGGQGQGRLSSVSLEQLDHSVEIIASQFNFETGSALALQNMGPDDNGNNGNEFISDKASKLLGISPPGRRRWASTATPSSHSAPCNQQQTITTTSYSKPTKSNEKQEEQQLEEFDKHQSVKEKDSPSVSSRASGPNAAPTASMRVVRDIAKMSVPSLSTLQYLPGKVGVSAKKVVSNNAGEMATKESLDKSCDDDSKPCQKHMAVGESERKKFIASNDDVQRDESSFLHRLCLCNCIAHHHQHQRQRPTNSSAKSEVATNISAPKSADMGATRSLSRSSDALTSTAGDHNMRSRRQRLLSSGDNQTKPAKRMRYHSRRGEDEGETLSSSTSGKMQTSHKKAASQRACQEPTRDATEKQSPKFLGLLELSAKSNKPHLGRVDDDCLGSDGDLVASLSRELDNSLSTDELGASESPVSHRRPRSALSATLTDDDGSCFNGGLSSSSPLSAKSAYSPTASQQEPKKTSTYRKFLSPSKLFGGSQTSNLNEAQNSQVESAGVERRPVSGSKANSSFLSRSLNRISGRKKSSSKQQIRPSNQEASQETGRRAPPKSPTISISNNSQQDSFTDSVNSLEDTSLPHSLPTNRNHGRVEATKSRLLTAPEIIVNQVEYADDRSDYSTRSACDMTRSSNAHNHSRRRHHHDDHRRGSPRRQASDYSDSIGDSASLQGPFSLPGSPRAARRYRSPRLSQTPVPFRSPASESSKIEDGLKVCSTEHFEKHIGNIKENQIEAQKRLFTSWINHFCPNLIRRDLVVELQDGIKLIGLLASLTHDKSLLATYEKLNRDKQSYVNRLVVTPTSRLKHLSNVSTAIDYLRKKLDMQLVNLNPMDIVSGKANVILGLCWNIILHFQLEQNIFKFPDGLSDNCSASSELSPSCTSRLSAGSTNEDRSSKRNLGQMITGTSANLMEEYSTRDLLTAKNKLLEHINRRFSLKLTKLSSNLVDGDVLLVIIKQLLPRTAPDENLNLKLSGTSDKDWEKMNDDEKLDHCFHLADKHLNVPQLFSASDLRQQSLSENNSKPLLIYLSMLLSSNPQTCSPDQMVELQQVDATLMSQQSVEEDSRIDSSATNDLELLIQEIDRPDKYAIEKLQTTLEKIYRLDELISKHNQSNSNQHLSESLINQHAQLKEEASQVESLIDWINRADRLFEMSQKSSVDLAKAINVYQSFFSPGNLPQVSVVLCPTLERQYRECLATAKQRVLSMEQTMKNWVSYEQARQELKDWLLSAESKLSNALRPNHQQPNGQSKGSSESMEPIEQHLSRLEELVDYFELEQLDCDDPLLFSSLDHSMSTSSLNFGQSSLSGSLISLGSTCSRLSTLTSSKKATYNGLFDDFELKCRLLAAMLDSDQKDALLLGVKELKSRLRYITEIRVPQVVNELRLHINRCELSIREQDETSEHDNKESSQCQQKDVNSDEDDQRQAANDISSRDVSEEREQEQEEEPGGSLLNRTKPLARRKYKNRNKSRNNKNADSKNKKKNKTNHLVETTAKEPPERPSYVRLFWNKLVRASRVSLSLNIVLLLCLAGICVVPLINRDACCELSQKTIPSQGFSIEQKPT